jgi:hypothetical protein
VALLDAAGDEGARKLSTALARAGHRPTLIGCRRGATTRREEAGVAVIDVRRLPEAPLRLRGFERPLTHLPRALGELLRERFDVVHAFTPADAAAARAWRRLRGGPVVFSPTRPLTRDRLSNRRLTLRLVAAAAEASDVLIVPDEAVRASVERWLALDAAVLAADDADAHARLYAGLL